eukprot:GHRR01032951.1.p1 GENE.GHRR01032951.1~~GHRR01032951.1.p1  ORF type:complete len:322 (+),score=104.07 GHRR01032951.1:936-1901(+)
MRMSASMCLVLMEMTGAPNTLPFLMLALTISKGVGDRFNYSVFDHQIMLKGFSFIGGIPEHLIKQAHLDAEDIMSKSRVSATFHIEELVENLLNTLDTHKTTGAFPVLSVPTQPDDPGNFMGIISRQSVMELVSKHGDNAEPINLSSKVEVAPVVIPPGMPLPFIYHVMQEQGLNYVPVIRQHGPLEGMVSRNDIVNVQNTQLDRFHVKEHMQQVAQDIDRGRILQSMHIEKQTAALVNAIKAPLIKTKDLLVKDIREHDELIDEINDHAPMIYLGPEGVRHTSSSRRTTRQTSLNTSAGGGERRSGLREEPRCHTEYDKL